MVFVFGEVGEDWGLITLDLEDDCLLLLLLLLLEGVGCGVPCKKNMLHTIL
jgi:hypothetical protein